MGLIKLTLGNFLIFVCTLGLGLPFIYHRNMQFFARNTQVLINNNLSLQQIAADKDFTSGEELSDIMEVDLDVALF